MIKHENIYEIFHVCLNQYFLFLSKEISVLISKLIDSKHVMLNNNYAQFIIGFVQGLNCVDNQPHGVYIIDKHVNNERVEIKIIGIVMMFDGSLSRLIGLGKEMQNISQYEIDSIINYQEEFPKKIILY